MTLHAAWTITGTVDDLYRPGAITATADDSLEQIAARLQDKDISALVILDGYRLAGIMTRHRPGRGRPARPGRRHRQRLHDHGAGHGGLETPLAEVARTMLAYGVRHLPVVAGEVLGMVSARDLLELGSATTG